MSRFRTHLMALLGGAMLLALSVSGALGHASSGDFGGGARNHGQAISYYVHSLVFGYEDAAEEEPVDEGDVDVDTEDTDADEETVDEESADTEADSAQSAGNAHGKCVSEVAHGDEVGGSNDNHGGAVSEAAETTCWEGPSDEPTDEPVVDAQAFDAGSGQTDSAHGQRGQHGRAR